MVGINIPCRIGAATCLPGDVVLGTISGVIFIPPHLLKKSVSMRKNLIYAIFSDFSV